MKRFKYGQNSAVNNYGKMFQVLPIGIMEVVPGDTVSGSIGSRIITDSVNRIIQNRCYHDVYSFYVPYRLVFEQFPDFIADLDTAISLPVFATESEQLLDRNTGSGTAHHSMHVRAYSLIWNKFFRTEEAPEIDITTNQAVQRAPMRPTTLMQRLKDTLDVPDTTVDTSGSTLSTGAIRDAFAQDRFDKIRGFYGSKYTDYLAAIGVEAGWSIVDDPELIGVKTGSLPFNTVDSTSDAGTDNVGDAGGRWAGSHAVNLKRTFTPEHGVIITVAVARMDVNSVYENYPLFAQKTTPQQFWQPQFETIRKREWIPGFGTDAAVTLVSEQYDEYRHPQNISVEAAGANGTYFVRPATENPMNASDAVAFLQYPDPDELDFFTGFYGEGVQLSLMGTSRLTKQSPVKPSTMSRGVA